VKHDAQSLQPTIPAQRILVVQFRMIGDVLLSTPVLRALRQHYPQSYMVFCTEAASAGVLKNSPYLDDILLHPRPATWGQEYQFLRRVRQSRFDLVIDLMGNPRSALLTCVSGARYRVAFAHMIRSLCYTHVVDHRHDVQGYTVSKRLRLLEPLGIHATDISLSLRYTAEDKAIVERFLGLHGVTPDDLLICVDPTSHVATREWPGENFSQLVNRLSQRLHARVCLLWGPGEQEQVQAIAAAAHCQPILHPPWELTQVAALLARADFFVGCSSAPMHIAVSQGTPTLTILGASPSVNWVPPLPQHRAVLAGLPCQPCNTDHCGPPLHIACLRSLTVDAVFAAVLACRPWVAKMQR
jgi:ADP-heptose:LPS heptosyltransferase